MTRSTTIMNGLALLILAVAGLWGASLYPQLPDVIPTHWNASGEADAFSEKSIWSVFGPLIIAAVTVLSLLILRHYLVRSTGLVPSERRLHDLSIGYGNLFIAALFSWISLMSWLGREPGPLFLALALLAGVPILIIIGLHMPAITRERQEQTGADEPSMNPEHWLLGGFF